MTRCLARIDQPTKTPSLEKFPAIRRASTHLAKHFEPLCAREKFGDHRDVPTCAAARRGNGVLRHAGVEETFGSERAAHRRDHQRQPRHPTADSRARTVLATHDIRSRQSAELLSASCQPRFTRPCIMSKN